MKCKFCKNEIPAGSIFCNWCGERQIRERKRKDQIKVPRPRQLPSGNWNIQLREEGQSITEPTKELCEAKAIAIRAGFLEARKKAPKLTLAQAIDAYIASRRATVSPATVRSYEKIKRTRFQGLMQTDVGNITPNTLQAAVSQEMRPNSDGKVISAKTLHDAFCFVKTVLDYHGIQLDLSHISLPEVQPSPYATLTPEEIAVLLNALPGNPCELPILLAVWLGLRRSEIIALTREDFDFSHSTVTIQRAIVQDEHNKYVTKGTKCAASTRIISCPAYILNKVKSLPPGPIYTHNAGYILKCLHRLCQDNGLPLVRLHDLRHVNASIMLMLNIPDKYAMERGGWATKQTMTGRYQHTFDAAKSDADAKVDAYFSNLLSHNFTNDFTNT